MRPEPAIRPRCRPCKHHGAFVCSCVSPSDPLLPSLCDECYIDCVGSGAGQGAAAPAPAGKLTAAAAATAATRTCLPPSFAPACRADRSNYDEHDENSWDWSTYDRETANLVLRVRSVGTRPVTWGTTSQTHTGCRASLPALPGTNHPALPSHAAGADVQSGAEAAHPARGAAQSGWGWAGRMRLARLPARLLLTVACPDFTCQLLPRLHCTAAGAGRLQAAVVPQLPGLAPALRGQQGGESGRSWIAAAHCCRCRLLPSWAGCPVRRRLAPTAGRFLYLLCHPPRSHPAVPCGAAASAQQRGARCIHGHSAQDRAGKSGAPHHRDPRLHEPGHAQVSQVSSGWLGGMPGALLARLRRLAAAAGLSTAFNASLWRRSPALRGRGSGLACKRHARIPSLMQPSAGQPASPSSAVWPASLAPRPGILPAFPPSPHHPGTWKLRTQRCCAPTCAPAPLSAAAASPATRSGAATRACAAAPELQRLETYPLAARLAAACLLAECYGCGC